MRLGEREKGWIRGGHDLHLRQAPTAPIHLEHVDAQGRAGLARARRHIGSSVRAYVDEARLGARPWSLRLCGALGRHDALAAHFGRQQSPRKHQRCVAYLQLFADQALKLTAAPVLDVFGVVAQRRDVFAAQQS
jgi:hypothetical protein